jgi:hypothetical protein
MDKFAFYKSPKYNGSGTLLTTIPPVTAGGTGKKEKAKDHHPSTAAPKIPGWVPHTGVFVPDGVLPSFNNWVTVLFWFHGYYVKGIEELFLSDGCQIIPAVNGVGKSLVVVAPYLGLHNGDKNVDYNALLLGGGRAETYLDMVLAALFDWSQQNHVGLDPDARAPGNFQIGNLYIAGHSGGGDGIRSAAGSLGRYREVLRECWGFDCLYGTASMWSEWARSQGGMPLYFYFGTGTQPNKRGTTDVIGFWRRVYGTLKSPLPLGGRLLNLHLAPALRGAEIDMVAFQWIEDIMARPTVPGSYEEVRKTVDPLMDLGSPSKYWSTLIAKGLKEHYPTASELLGPRIRQSVY